MGWWSLLWRTTTPADRWVVVASALAIAWGMIAPFTTVAHQVEVYRENRLERTLPLATPARIQVAGRLGAVTVEVGEGRARLLEYQSPRLIGTRTGWIGRAGQVAACVPCGVMIRVTGPPAPKEGGFDALVH